MLTRAPICTESLLLWEHMACQVRKQSSGVKADLAELGEDGAAQHGAQEDVEDVPPEEEGADAPVHAAQAGPLALAQRTPAALAWVKPMP